MSKERARQKTYQQVSTGKGPMTYNLGGTQESRGLMYYRSVGWYPLESCPGDC